MRLLSSLLVLVLAAGYAQAQQEAAKTGKADREFISLLEFLGEFTTEDGEWIDPDVVEQSGPVTRKEDEDNDNGSLTARQPTNGVQQDR
jgi:hypothetical protein